MIHQKGTPAPIAAEEERKETIVRTIKFQTAGREEHLSPPKSSRNEKKGNET